MHDLDVIHRLNAEACGRGEPQPPYALRLHPTICALRHEVDALPVSSRCHRWLRYALWRHADWFIGRKEPAPEDGWSNFEALQQLALMEGSDAWLRGFR